MDVGTLLALVETELGEAGVDQPGREAAFLLSWFVGVKPVELHLRRGQEVPRPVLDQVQAALRRRKEREPLAYILGEQEFWGLSFKVSPAVLVPRPETELLVEEAVRLVRASSAPWVLDLGCGSGAISVALAHECRNVRVVAVERSLEALAVARFNVQRHRVASQVMLVAGDWLSSLARSARFDLVVSNPPYIATGVIPTLMPEVRDHEPWAALDGGNSGLDAITFLAGAAPELLRPGGLLLMEIGADQKQEAFEIFSATGKYARVEVLPDLAGLPRLVRAKLH